MYRFRAVSFIALAAILMLDAHVSGQAIPAPKTDVTPCNYNCLDAGNISPAPVRTDPALDRGRHRLVVLTDMGADNDDSQSLIRLLLYSNEIDIEGLIATTSTFMMDRVNPALITRGLDAYRQARPNLLKHDPHYPTYESLAAVTQAGAPLYGMGGVGPGHDSSGSTLLMTALKRNDPRPLWVAIWGGANTLAQALWKISSTETPARAQDLVSRLRVYSIGDQDDSGPWLRKTYPALFWITPIGFDTGIASRIPASSPESISAAWLSRNVQQGHGPMGEAYPDSAYAMEGDTPSFLGLIPNGLNDPSHPKYGGWGGRFALYTPTVPIAVPPRAGMRNQNVVKATAETRAIWTAASDTYPGPMVWVFPRQPPAPDAPKSAGVTVWRWREDFQNDFAARMDWTVKPYAEANHPPIVALGENTPAEFTVHSGKEFHLNAAPSHDPDHDSLSWFWFQYVEAGELESPVTIAPFAQNLADLPVVAPPVTAPKTVHFIVRVTDKGTPALSRYARVIVHVLP